MDETCDMRLITYCGLYCGDCAGRTGEIASAARALLDVMERYEFRRTALGMFPDRFSDYDALVSSLEFMSRATCDSPCRDREPACAIAECCVGRGHDGCYECDEFRGCEKLHAFVAVCGHACFENLERIREMGPEAWVSSGRRLWFSKEAGGPDAGRSDGPAGKE